MTISVASVADAPRAAELFRAVFEDRVITVEGFRYRMANVLPEDRLEYWRAEHEGELRGWAFGGLDAFASAGTAAFAGIVVHPAHRGNGIGSALWDVLLPHLESNAPMLAINAKLGYEPLSVGHAWVLER